MQRAERYDIQLRFVRQARNPHQNEAPVGAPFLVIGPRSPLSWRRAVEELAYFFRREFDFDFPPFTAEECKYATSDISRDRVMVFAEETVAPGFVDVLYFIGAAGVRWIEWSDAPASWSVEWVWFHPYERGRGHFAEAWPYILKMFPNPRVTHPLSKAMAAFLSKVGYTSPLMQQHDELTDGAGI